MTDHGTEFFFCLFSPMLLWMTPQHSQAVIFSRQSRRKAQDFYEVRVAVCNASLVEMLENISLIGSKPSSTLCLSPLNNTWRETWNAREGLVASLLDTVETVKVNRRRSCGLHMVSNEAIHLFYSFLSLISHVREQNHSFDQSSAPIIITMHPQPTNSTMPATKKRKTTTIIHHHHG